MWSRARARVILLVLSLAVAANAAGFATRTLPMLSAAPKYADFVYPIVPKDLGQTADADRIDAGWRFLQNDDLRSADREFANASSRAPGFYPARTGTGYVALAGRDYARAAAAFEAVLRVAPRYVPALVGSGQTLLAQSKDAEALAAFEAALAVDDSLADVRRRADLLRFRRVQDLIASARVAAAVGRNADARAAYGQALEASPDSAFLYHELGMLERQAGIPDAALAHLTRAAELDPADNLALGQIGELLELRGDFAGAEAAYRKAAAIEPSAGLVTRIEGVVERGREARLPAEFAAIPTARAMTRGALAALLGVRLESMLRAIPLDQAVMTDTGGHWARQWIEQVARARVIPAFENHTFQPGGLVTRGDLAAAVNRLVSAMAVPSPDLRLRLSRSVRVADMSMNHLSYAAVSIAVSSGVMPLLAGDRFEVGRLVSGAEAVAIVDRIRTLARTSR